MLSGSKMPDNTMLKSLDSAIDSDIEFFISKIL